MANRNRTAGNQYERDIVNELKELGFSTVVTSRSESRNMDNSKVDIFDPEDNFPFYIQNKVLKTYPNLNELIHGEDVNKKRPLIVFHKKVIKKNTRFFTEGEFVSMDKQIFYDLLMQAYGNNEDEQLSQDMS